MTVQVGLILSELFLKLWVFLIPKPGTSSSVNFEVLGLHSMSVNVLGSPNHLRD